MRRLLVVGQGKRHNGYGRVMRNVLARVGIDSVLFAVDWREGTPPPGVRGNHLLGDRFGAEQLPALLRELRPDVVLVHNDATHYEVHRRAIEAYGGARAVVYCPIDWCRVPPAVPIALAGADRVVAYTRFGRDVLARAFDDAGVRAPPVATIPHGVDTSVFRPVGTRAAARRRLFADRPELAGAFVVLNANRNIRRKRVDLTLHGFARFARGRPDAYLYLHMGMVDRGYDVAALAAELGIGDRLLVTTREPERPSVSDEHLNLIYNACDVGLTTSEGEGWGMVAFEHAATGAAQVVPDGGACAELWGRDGVLVPASPSDRGGHLVAPEDVARALGRLYDDRALLAAMAHRARAHARSPEFDWGAIAARWEAALLD